MLSILNKEKGQKQNRLIYIVEDFPDGWDIRKQDKGFEITALFPPPGPNPNPPPPTICLK